MKKKRVANKSNTNKRSSERRPISNGVKTYTLIYGMPDRDFYARHKKENILFCETRPSLFGAKILAKELKKKKMKSTLICDSALGHLFFMRHIKKVYLFKTNGNIFLPGALGVKILADFHKIPVEITNAGQLKKMPLTDKDASTFLGKRVSIKKIKTLKPQNEVIS
ncbi:MAG TPA: hypothetical protein ENH41_01585 [Candidatus Omnitrophica bacterium]|nr:hypothetical protein [Candidatus Omnitrophota bacterium]